MSSCPVCSAPNAPVDARLVAIVVVLAVLLVYLLGRAGRKREGFVSPQAHEVYERSRELFGRGDAHFSEFKATVPSADAVTYTDIRRLWRDGNLSPQTVAGVI